MTRPKVAPDKRQRTAQACDSCKRRKQKCNGTNPCNTCLKRKSRCTYDVPPNGSDAQQPSSRRGMTDPIASPVSSPINGRQTVNIQAPGLHHVSNQDPSHWVPFSVQPSSEPSPPLSNPMGSDGEDALHRADRTSRLFSPGQDEEAVIYSNTRMLQDSTGRLLYVGDSATLSFLQLIRMIVENVTGPTPFTMDPRRHMIVENTFSLPLNVRRTHVLPDKQTALVLLNAFFVNTNGLIEIFHQKSFLHALDVCYADPLNVDPSWLCLLYLTLAIGLVTAVPTPGTREDAIIQKLRGEPVDRAELFYSDAKHLGDPFSGFEDAGFWSIQALTLMSLYMLIVSKRNAAYALFGMAVRSAFALGLHREEAMCIFSPAEQMVRRNLWRSLYILDRFLAASLGRPTSIREDDCSGDTLSTGDVPSFPQVPSPDTEGAGTLGLGASVRSCHVIGVILEKVYSQRKISTKLAQEIADHCKGWPKALDPDLNWGETTPTNPTHGIAILHVNLLYYHSIILLTRPFFLFLMNKLHQKSRQSGTNPPKKGGRMENFGEACVAASGHSIVLVQNAFEGHYLPNRNPFVLYFLFASALVVLSNEFSSLFENPSANSCITNAINVMRCLAQLDQQANRLLFILTSFHDAVVRHKAQSSISLTTPRQSSRTLAQPITVENDLTISEDIIDCSPVKLPSLMVDAPPHSKGIYDASSNVSSLNPAAPLHQQFSSTDLGNNGSSAPQHHGTNLAQSPSSFRHRQDSLDAFLDLAGVSSNGGDDASDTFGNDEILFENLWQWPSTPSISGNTSTPGSIAIIPGVTPVIMGNSGQQGTSDQIPIFGKFTDYGGG